MEAPQAEKELSKLARDLLSNDPVLFNSTINTKFSSLCEYHGHGLCIKGASNIKHAAWLLNLLDAGQNAKIDDKHIKWDASSKRADIKATRYIRPRLFPLFQFAIDTNVVLKFGRHDSLTGTFETDTSEKKETETLLYCTKFEDNWPLDSWVRSLPLLGMLYCTFWVPIATIFVLQVSNFAFALFAQIGSFDRKVEPKVRGYAKAVESKMPKGLKGGFENGVKLAEQVGNSAYQISKSPIQNSLHRIEWATQTITKTANALLPKAFQLPLPTVFSHNESKSGVSGVQSQESSTPPQGSGKQKAKSGVSQGASNGQSAKKGGDAESDQPKFNGSDSSNHQEKPTTEDHHAKVVLGPSIQENQPQAKAKEIDLVTHQVTEKDDSEKPEAQETGPSLYDQIKRDEALGDATNTAGRDSSPHSGSDSLPKQTDNQSPGNKNHAQDNENGRKNSNKGKKGKRK